MGRVRDLWHVDVRDPSDPTKQIKRKTARHPSNGGSKTAKRWLAIWNGPDGKEKSKVFQNKDNAKAHWMRQEADIERGEYIEPKANKELFGPLAKKWIRLRDVGPNTLRKYESTNRNHVEKTFGHRQIKAIKPSDVLEWQRELADKVGPQVQAFALDIVAGTFDLALADKLRRDNPARSPIIDRPKVNWEKEKNVWTQTRVWAVIDALPVRYQAIGILSAGLGLREGEAFGLAEEDFDFDAGLVHIRRQVFLLGGKYVFKLPKRGRVRSVPMSQGIARVVKAHIKTYPPRPYELPWLLEGRGGLGAEPHACKLLFRWASTQARTHDQHIRAASYRDVWMRALLKAGVVEAPKKGERVTLSSGRTRLAPLKADRDDGTHALRHWYSTTLQDSEVSLAGVMAFMGHSTRSAVVTVGVYGHVTDETREKARNVVDRELFKLRAVQDQQPAGTVTELAVGE